MYRWLNTEYTKKHLNLRASVKVISTQGNSLKADLFLLYETIMMLTYLLIWQNDDQMINTLLHFD